MADNEILIKDKKQGLTENETLQEKKTLKKIYWILALIGVFFLGDRIGGYLFNQAIDKSGFRYSRMYRGEANCDLLFMGNSRGLGFYQPYIEEVTGKKTFNLSYNALPIDLGRALLEDYLANNKKPEVFVLDVSMTNRIDTTLISGFNVYTPYSESVSEVVKDVVPKVYYGGKLSHLFLHNGEIFQRAIRYLNNTDEAWLNDRVISDGLIGRVHELHDSIVGPFNENQEIVEFIYDELKSTVQIAKDNNIKVKLVINPFFPKYANKMVNYEDFVQKVETLTGLKVHNYAKAIQNKDAFSDFQHLNRKGSQQYIDLLKREGIFD